MEYNRSSSGPIPAEAVYTQLIGFSENFPDFRKESVNGKLFFVRNFPKKKLRIIVETPYIFAKNPDNKALIERWYRIIITLKRRDETCMEMRSQISRPNWQSSTKIKINKLLRVIENAPECPTCKKDSLYPVKRSVSYTYECAFCGKTVTPKYKTGHSSHINGYLV